MDKKQSINFLKIGHSYFQKVLTKLNKEQLKQNNILGTWGIKEIIAHLTAWNLEQARAVDLILANSKPEWWGIDAVEFNKIAVAKSQDLNFDEVLKDWEESFVVYISRLEKISDDDFIYQACLNDPDSPIDIKTMLAYHYRDLDHEGGHAQQLEEFFKIS